MVKKNLRFFLNSLNEFDPCIMFTYESNKESIALPDIRVSLRNGKVFTDLYFKPTDRHQYLHYLSPFFFFYYLGFLSRTFTIHGTAGQGGGYLFNSSLPLPPASQTLRH